MRFLLTLVVLALAGPPETRAADPDAKRTAPVTRPDMKKALEALKKSRPRLPMPPVTAAEKEKWGGRVVNNARMRRLYLPPELVSTGFPRGADPNMTLDNTFKVMLFWIVSRTNDCHY
jgi:hypothetical protein